MFAFQNDINGYLTTKIANAKHGIVAGGAADGTEVTGVVIDRQSFGSGSVNIGAVATLTEAETLSLTVKISQSDDGSTFETATTIATLTGFLTGGAGGSTEMDVSQVGLNLEGYKRYIRIDVTPDLSASATDTAAYVVTAVLGGKKEY